MYVYIQSEGNMWTSGFYDPEGLWIAEKDHSNPEDASKRVHFLNGGNDENYKADSELLELLRTSTVLLAMSVEGKSITCLDDHFNNVSDMIKKLEGE